MDTCIIEDLLCITHISYIDTCTKEDLNVLNISYMDTCIIEDLLCITHILHWHMYQCIKHILHGACIIEDLLCLTHLLHWHMYQGGPFLYYTYPTWIHVSRRTISVLYISYMDTCIREDLPFESVPPAPAPVGSSPPPPLSFGTPLAPGNWGVCWWHRFHIPVGLVGWCTYKQDRPSLPRPRSTLYTN